MSSSAKRILSILLGHARTRGTADVAPLDGLEFTVEEMADQLPELRALGMIEWKRGDSAVVLTTAGMNAGDFTQHP